MTDVYLNYLSPKMISAENKMKQRRNQTRQRLICLKHSKPDNLKSNYYKREVRS